MGDLVRGNRVFDTDLLDTDLRAYPQDEFQSPAHRGKGGHFCVFAFHSYGYRVSIPCTSG